MYSMALGCFSIMAWLFRNRHSRGESSSIQYQSSFHSQNTKIVPSYNCTKNIVLSYVLTQENMTCGCVADTKSIWIHLFTLNLIQYGICKQKENQLMISSVHAPIV